MKKTNWEMISIMEDVAFKHLSNMLINKGYYEIEFASWVIGNTPQPPTCPTLPNPSNVFMWYDNMSGYWVMFCGIYWKWGKKNKFPELGMPVPTHGWKRCGFIDEE